MRRALFYFVIITIFRVLFFDSYPIYVQKNILILKNRDTGKETQVNQGKNLKITCKDGRIYTGQLKIIDSSNIEIYDYINQGEVFSLIINKLSKVFKLKS